MVNLSKRDPMESVLIVCVVNNEDSKVATEVFHWIVGEKEDAKTPRDFKVRPNVVEESACVYRVQDR